MTVIIIAILVILVIKLMSFLKSFAQKTRLIYCKKEHQDSLIPILLPSIFSMCICIVCIFSMTWAWFSVDVNGGTNIIKAAQYYIEAEVKNNDVIMQPENGEYILPNGIYNVTLTARGSASTGYCKIKILDGLDEKEIYTEQINKSTSITFNININIQDDSYVTISFYPIWGIGENVSGINGTTIDFSTIPETPEETDLDEEEEGNVEELETDEDTDEKSDNSDEENQDSDIQSSGDTESSEPSTPTQGDTETSESSTPTQGDTETSESSTPTQGDTESLEPSTPTQGNTEPPEPPTPSQADTEPSQEDNSNDVTNETETLENPSN